MATKIEDIEANYEQILSIVGSESYVNWESFTKSSTELVKSIDLLMQSLTVLKEIQQKRFITAMKKLKGSDIPDLIKTVRAKKLPRQALKAVLSKFKINEQGSIQLEGTTESLKEESKNTYEAYVNVNDVLTNQIKETVGLVNAKIQESGLYEPPALPKELVSTFKHEFNPQLLEIIKKEIPILPQPGTNGLFNIQTYGKIISSTYQVVKDEYKRLTIESRKKQRQVIGNSKKYTEALMEYLTNTEVLIIEGQKAIVNKIGVGEKVMEASEVKLMESGLAQTIVFIQSGLRTKVKESVLPTKQVSVDKTIEIIKFQIESIPKNTAYFKEMLGGLERTNENFQLVPLLIALTLNDLVFQRFGYEEEDFMKNVTDQILFNNTEFANLFREMETSIINLMKDAGVINEDMARIMQIHSQQIQSQVAQMDPTAQGQNPQSGVFPGSDPMQLLQYRLNEQLNQVDKK